MPATPTCASSRSLPSGASTGDLDHVASWPPPNAGPPWGGRRRARWIPRGAVLGAYDARCRADDDDGPPGSAAHWLTDAVGAQSSARSLPPTPSKLPPGARRGDTTRCHGNGAGRLPSRTKNCAPKVWVVGTLERSRGEAGPDPHRPTRRRRDASALCRPLPPAAWPSAGGGSCWRHAAVWSLAVTSWVPAGFPAGVGLACHGEAGPRGRMGLPPGSASSTSLDDRLRSAAL